MPTSSGANTEAGDLSAVCQSELPFSATSVLDHRISLQQGDAVSELSAIYIVMLLQSLCAIFAGAVSSGHWS